MTALDKIIVILALAGLIAFNSVVLWFVSEPDLIIVVSSVLALTCYDFWRSSSRKAK